MEGPLPGFAVARQPEAAIKSMRLGSIYMYSLLHPAEVWTPRTRCGMDLSRNRSQRHTCRNGVTHELPNIPPGREAAVGKQCAPLTQNRVVEPCDRYASQRSLHSASIFRLLLKVAVKGTH